MQKKAQECLTPISNQTVFSVFEERVHACPHAPAVFRPDGDCWSYSRLNSFANRVAHLLLRRGLRPEQPVGVCMQRSPETVGVLLGILKARGAYVPLDVNLPIERFRYVAQDAMLREIFVDAHGTSKLRDAELTNVELLSDSGTYELSDHSPRLPGSCRDLLTLLYTSGSTGKPKGVMLEHAAALRLVTGAKWMTFSASDVFLQISSLSFDAATFEIWGPLLNGGSLVTAPPSPSIAEIESLLDAFSVTTLWLTSGLFNVVMDERPAAIRNLKHLLVGGDVVSPRHARVALQHLKRGELLNCYGPTENTTFSTCHRVTRSDTQQRSVPIGRSVDKSPVYLFDDAMRPVRNSDIGEIFVGGEGLSRGYWNRPDLNSQKFVSLEVEPNVRMRLYRTGDLARHNGAGLLEFVGRTDFQVKIRGFRVEPEEIELALCSMPGVASAAVIARGASAESKVLCCAYVADGTRPITVDAIRTYLKGTVPDYMMPTFYKQVDTLPRNTNDKVDRKALDALFGGSLEQSDSMDQSSQASERQPETLEHLPSEGECTPGTVAKALRHFAASLGFSNARRVLSQANQKR